MSADDVSKSDSVNVIEEPGDLLEQLKHFTSARIALGRSGHAIPTHELLKFQLEHARARDAVTVPLNTQSLVESIKSTLGHFMQEFPEPLLLQSMAADRFIYLQRPDLGKKLAQECTQVLQKKHDEYDLSICIVDGLSSLAIENNAVSFLRLLFDKLTGLSLKIAPLSIVTQGRVAIGDQVANGLGAKLVLVLIGERPGLLSPDSLGLYLTYGPTSSSHDAQRNCVSNVRTGGLSYNEAVTKVLYLLNESNRLGFSGVDLKDRVESTTTGLQVDENFLI